MAIRPSFVPHEEVKYVYDKCYFNQTGYLVVGEARAEYIPRYATHVLTYSLRISRHQLETPKIWLSGSNQAGNFLVLNEDVPDGAFQVLTSPQPLADLAEGLKISPLVVHALVLGFREQRGVTQNVTR